MIMLDYQDRRPLYEQVAEKLEQMIVNGVLKENDQLPSVRSLAMELSINPNTIQRAYAKLEKNGFIYPVKGRGNFVASSSEYLESRRKDFMQALEKLVRQGIQLGVGRQEMYTRIDQVFQGGKPL